MIRLPTSLKVAATAVHPVLFILLPGAGFLLLSMDIIPDAMDTASSIQEALEFALAWLPIVVIGVVLSGTSLLWTLWGKPPGFIRYYTWSWIVLFSVMILPVGFFTILFALSHPPPLMMFMGGMLLMPLPITLLLSTLVAFVPGVIFAVLYRIPRS